VSAGDQPAIVTERQKDVLLSLFIVERHRNTQEKKKRLEWFLFCIEGTVYPRSELQEDKTREDRKKRRSAH
jgi:hypothetical protein